MRHAMILVWLMAAAARGQVVGLVYQHRPPFMLSAEKHMASALVLPDWYAVTCAHVLHKGRYPGAVWVGGHPADVLYVDDDLALLRISTEVTESPLSLEGWGRRARSVYVQDGEPLEHRYYDHWEKRVRKDLVYWQGGSYVRPGFDHGMSGSGVFKVTGELVGVLESTNGFVWNLTHIAGFLEKYDQLR